MDGFWGAFGQFAGTMSLGCFILLAVFWWKIRHEVRLLPRSGRKSGAPRSSWLAWINKAFREGESSLPRWTRDDASKEFDARVGSLLSYQALQRFAVAAPLCGVIITMWKFLTYQAPSSEDAPGLGQILQTAAGPLFVGVGSGATAALVCQACLLVANRVWSDARIAAMRWFDREVWERIDSRDEVWGHIDSKMERTVEKTINALAEFAALLSQAGENHAQTSNSLEQASKKVEVATTTFVTVIGQVSHLSGQLSKGADAVATAVAPLARLAASVPNLEAAITQGQQAVGTFGKLVTDHLAPASNAFHTAGTDIQASAVEVRTQQQQTARATLQLQTAVGDLTQGVTTFIRATEQMSQLTERLSGGTDNFTTAVAPLARLAASVPNLEAAITQGQQAVGTFGKLVTDHLAPASNAFHTAGTDIQASAVAVRTQQQQAGIAATQLQTAVGDLTQAAQTHKTCTEQLTRGAGQLEQSVKRLDTASKGLANFETNAVQPIQQGFAGLNATLQQLQGTAVGLRQLLDMQQQLQPLFQALADAARVASHFNQMPSQVQSALAAMQTALVSSTQTTLQALRQEVSTTCTTVGQEMQQALNGQRQTVQQASTAIGQLPVQLAQSLQNLRTQLTEFAEAILHEQATSMEITLEQILGKMNRRNGAASGT